MKDYREYKVERHDVDLYLTEYEFIQWYNRSPIAGLETILDLLENAKSPKYSYGYYMGMGYKVTHKPEVVGVTPIQQSGCKHPRKYLNKISNALQFVVCPDCKQEVKEDKSSWESWMVV